MASKQLACGRVAAHIQTDTPTSTARNSKPKNSCLANRGIVPQRGISKSQFPISKQQRRCINNLNTIPVLFGFWNFPLGGSIPHPAKKKNPALCGVYGFFGLERVCRIIHRMSSATSTSLPAGVSSVNTSAPLAI